MVYFMSTIWLPKFGCSGTFFLSQVPCLYKSNIKICLISSLSRHTVFLGWSLAQRNRLYHLHLHVLTISLVYGSLANDHVLFQKKHPWFITIFLMGITNFYHLSILNLIFVIIPIGYMVNIYKNISYLLPTTDPDINNSNIEALS